MKCECGSDKVTFLAATKRTEDRQLCDKCVPPYLYSFMWTVKKYPENRKRRPIIKPKKKEKE